MNKQPTIQALILLHSIDEYDFEIMDIAFPYTNQKELEQEYEKEVEKWKESDRIAQLISELCRLDSIIEDATVDLGGNGDVSKDIHKELWAQNKKEQYYCINVDLYYSETMDYFGEVDVDVDYEYQILSIEKEWQHLDLLQKDDKLYYIDYEESGVSYTIVGIHTVTDNELQLNGLWYDVHSDQLSNATGYYSISMNMIDSNNIKDRFFSTPELAHEAYVKFQEYTNNRDDIDIADE